MKKLMIAAAIVCAAAITQAASFTWSADYVVNSSAQPIGGVARVFMVDQVAIDVISAEIAKGDFTSWLAYGQDEKLENASARGYTFTESYPATGTAGEHNFYAVILNADTTGAATSFFVTADVLKELKDGEGMETPVALGNQFAAASNPDNWKSISSVPEPTSGLLLLLGVAGLALRRRRA